MSHRSVLATPPLPIFTLSGLRDSHLTSSCMCFFVGRYHPGIRSHLHQILSSPPYSLNTSSLDPWFFPTPTQYSRLLTSAGFRILSIENVPRPNPLPQGLYAWLETFARNSFLSTLSDEDAAKVMREVERRCEVDCRDAEGGWEVMYMRLRWVAVLD